MDRTRLSRNPMTQKDPQCQRRPQRHVLLPCPAGSRVEHACPLCVVDFCCRADVSPGDCAGPFEAAVNGSNPTRGVMGANGSDMSVLLQAASSRDFGCADLVCLLPLGLVLRLLHFRSDLPMGYLGCAGQQSSFLIVAVMLDSAGSVPTRIDTQEIGCLRMVIVLPSFTPSARKVSDFSATYCRDMEVSFPDPFVKWIFSRRWFLSLTSRCRQSATSSVPLTEHGTTRSW